MWRGAQRTLSFYWSEVHSIIHDLLKEIALRVVVIAIVCIFQLKVPPRMCHITESELLSHYQRPRQDSYVPSWAIVIIVVFIPLMFFYIVFTRTKDYVDIIQALLAWTFALSLNAVVTEMLKLIVGRPRPDFFYRCFPNGKMKTVTSCTGDIRDILEGRKSFPSGHSSFSFCSLGFLSLWTVGKLRASPTRCLCGVLACILPLVIAGIVAISRVYDNHHHWTDIFFGCILGLMSSYIGYHEYYFPLNSLHTGEPLTTMTEEELFESYEMECCTRSLHDDLCLMLHLSNKNSLESNKKDS